MRPKQLQDYLSGLFTPQYTCIHCTHSSISGENSIVYRCSKTGYDVYSGTPICSSFDHQYDTYKNTVSTRIHYKQHSDNDVVLNTDCGIYAPETKGIAHTHQKDFVNCPECIDMIKIFEGDDWEPNLNGRVPFYRNGKTHIYVHNIVNTLCGKSITSIDTRAENQIDQVTCDRCLDLWSSGLRPPV